MKKTYQMSLFLATVLLIAGCGEDWKCETNGKSMYSISSSGKLGGAAKGCSCDEIRSFELKQFGKVDEEALKRDFGC